MILLRLASLAAAFCLLWPAADLQAQTESTVPADTVRVYRSDELEPDSQPTYDPLELAQQIRYPEDALMNGIEGDVEIEAVIDSSGVPLSVTAMRTDSPLFVEASLDAVGRLRFTPGRIKGNAVRTVITIPVRFRLAVE
jgi:TonB family protein